MKRLIDDTDPILYILHYDNDNLYISIFRQT